MARLPEYCVCAQCGELDPACLRVVSGRVLCANCSNNSKRKPQQCAICGRRSACENHHVAGRTQIRSVRLRICLNCHRILSARQYEWVGWPNEFHPVRYLIQGVRDVLALWWERSQDISHNRELRTMLGCATRYAEIAWPGLGSDELTCITSWEG